MLAANAKPDSPFEDYSIFVYRQTARNFEDRVKDLEKKFTYIPVRMCDAFWSLKLDLKSHWMHPRIFAPVLYSLCTY